MLNELQIKEREEHTNFTSGVITRVLDHGEYFMVEDRGGGFIIKKPTAKVPEVGQRYKLYCYQGMLIQGIDLEGESLYFHTRGELEARRQAELKSFRS